ncbi:MAG: hypothetical protein AAF242_11835 [Bacteroidota bacterium]
MLAELIASVIAMHNGVQLDHLMGQFSNNTATLIRNSLKGLSNLTRPSGLNRLVDWF